LRQFPSPRDENSAVGGMHCRRYSEPASEVSIDPYSRPGAMSDVLLFFTCHLSENLRAMVNGVSHFAMSDSLRRLSRSWSPYSIRSIGHLAAALGWT